ncbi:MAG: ROK family transcriptional regulator [Nitratireductor sp.]|nr:ROK family transcriptional regulator [Nitratireductor sp.]
MSATEISRSDDLRRENQRRILSALRADSPQSRTGLSAKTGLSASTVTTITSALLESGILVEALPASVAEHAPQSRRGRPQVALALNPAAATIGALTVTLNQLSASLIDYSGNVIGETRVRVNTQHLERGAFSKRLAALLQEFVDANRSTAGPLSQIVVAVQGTSDFARTCLQWSPITPHREIAIGAELHAHFGVPAQVENDTNMMASALHADEPWRFGDSFATILLSHGIGMGMYVKDRMFTGTSSSAAEFGHMCHLPGGSLCRCGRHGCIEAYAGDYGIWRKATGGNPNEVPEKDFDPDTMAELAGRARAGDEQAREAYLKAGEAIGHGLRSLFALLDPMPVAFVGSGAAAFDLMEPMIRQSLGQRGVGLSYEDPRLYCYPNEFELTRRGTVVTALNALDRNLQIVHEARELENAD